jgi:hypothetical protein
MDARTFTLYSCAFWMIRSNPSGIFKFPRESGLINAMFKCVIFSKAILLVSGKLRPSGTYPTILN